MKAIIYHSVSKKKQCQEIASRMDGDLYRIESVKKEIRFVPFQMIYYGMITVTKRKVSIKKLNLNLDKYDEIVLVSPVWAGQVNAFMRQFLMEYPLQNKKVSIVGSCDGGYKKYFKTFQKYIDSSNEIIAEKMYVKGILE